MSIEGSYKEAFIRSLHNYKGFLLAIGKEEEKAEEIIMDLIDSELTYDFWEETETLIIQLKETVETLEEEMKKRDQIESRREYVNLRY